MRVLIIGSGAREHALSYAIARSQAITYIACLPGNGGTSAVAENIPLDPLHIDTCVSWAKANTIDLIIIGPDDPLAAGIVDAFQREGLLCLGPTQAAARIESSKVWSKDFMQRHNIPNAAATVVTAENLDSAIASLNGPTATYPIAVKVDGLAAGKGVVIAHNSHEAEAALFDMITAQRFGGAGSRVVLEEFLYGREVSVFALSDGKNYRLFGTACDYKRAYDHDQGTNTGGMGAYSPAVWLTESELQEIETRIIAPTIKGMAAEGYPFVGFLFAGIMLTSTGPVNIEFNARFGDPEAEVILPRLVTPLLDLAIAAAQGQLATQPPIEWTEDVLCDVVITAKDYPTSSARGMPITGIETLDPDILVFHAGTRFNDNGQLETNGGRILNIIGRGPTLAAARDRSYANIDRVQFAGARHRSDIGANIL